MSRESKIIENRGENVTAERYSKTKSRFLEDNAHRGTMRVEIKKEWERKGAIESRWKQRGRGKAVI